MKNCGVTLSYHDMIFSRQMKDHVLEYLTSSTLLSALGGHLFFNTIEQYDVKTNVENFHLNNLRQYQP
jgi:hypothetical protein